MSESQAHRTRRFRSREEADRLVMEFEQSGLTRRIFCRQHGLSPATLDNYRKRRTCSPSQAQDAVSATTSGPAVRLVPVELVERSSSHRQMAVDGASLHIELAGGRRIAVTAGFEAATLTRLLAVLDEAQRVLGLGAATRIYVATDSTDMRLGFNGLYALVTAKLQQNPQSGHLFLFANKRRDRMKILFFDSNSLWVCARRMEQGRLHWPASEDGRVQLTREEFALLIGGIDLTTTTRRKWYRKTVAEEVCLSRKVA